MFIINIGVNYVHKQCVKTLRKNVGWVLKVRLYDYELTTHGTTLMQRILKRFYCVARNVRFTINCKRRHVYNELFTARPAASSRTNFPFPSSH